MKTLVKIAFLSAAALTMAGVAHADHRDYRIARFRRKYPKRPRL